MLPKIRPATGNGPQRPSIRPVKPAPLPPRPVPPQSLPRRVDSGFGPKGHMREPYDSHGEAATAIADYNEPPEPPTQAGPRQTVRQVVPMAFEDETQARPVDDHLLAQMKAPIATAPIDAPYDSLPSLEVRPPFDAYEQQFVERDPAAQIAAARESHRGRQTVRRDEPSYPVPRDIGSGARARPAPSPWDEAQDHGWQREASGPQQRSWNPPPDPMIPQAPRVPHDARPLTQPPFVMGVQPIRTPAPVYPSPAPQAMHHAQQYPQSGPQLPQEPMQRTHAMMPTGPAVYRAPVSVAPSPSAQVDAADASAKAGRFAWFVFGAAFGIAFAFFATGFAPRIGAKDKEPEPLFPPAASLPAATATPTATAPAAVVAPPPPAAVTAPPIVAAPPPTMTVASPTALPQAPPAPPAQVFAAPQAPVAQPQAVQAPQAPQQAPQAPQAQTRAPAPPVTAAAPPPPPPRRNWSPPPSPPRRPAPESTGPKPLLGGGGTEAPAGGAPDVNDILSGALKP